MKTILSLSLRPMQLCRVAALMLCVIGFAPGQRLGAADLKPQTIAAWDAYVRLTEKRISSELNNGQKFLLADFLGNTESSAVHSQLQRGQVVVLKMNTNAEEGGEIPVPEGLIHH